MKPIGLFSMHRATYYPIALGLMLGAVGCEETKDEFQPCDEMCSSIDFTTFPNCDLTCGVDAADDPHVGFLARVFGIGLGATASSDEVATCELAVSNCELSECQIIYGVCLNEGTPSECLDVYDACVQQQFELMLECNDEHSICLDMAESDRQICRSSAVTPEEEEACDQLYDEAVVLCDCEHEFCLNGTPVSECLAESGARTAPTRVGPNRWRVPRELIDLTLGNLEQLQQDAGVTRWRRAGRDHFEGLKLWLIQKGDLLHAIGLRAGDVLLSVNGMHLRSENLTLKALAPLYSASALELRVQRDGRVIELRYDLIDVIGK